LRRHAILLGVVVVAAALRMTNLERAPAGLNVDEAVSAWNAWCLAETGRDQHGLRWPITETAGFGQGTTTLYVYVLAPFYKFLGMTTTATRLPAAIAGAIGVAMIAYVAAQMFEAGAGIVAAILLCISPWHLMQSRWGHMACLFPLAVIVAVAALIWAGLPIVRGNSPRPARAAIAGAATAVFLYGYYAIRLWIPLFVVILIVFTFPEWLAFLKSRRGRIAAAMYAAAALLVASPLIVGTFTNPLMMKRASTIWAWSADDRLAVRIGKVAERYLPHFGLDFLFRRGDPYPAMQPPPDHGYFLYFTLPLMIVGALWVAAHFREVEARALAALVAVYPAADLLSAHDGPHGLRSIPGIVALTLLAAVGAVSLYRYFARASRVLGFAVAALIAIVGSAETIALTRSYFSRMDATEARFFGYNADLVAACKWIAPRVDRYDAVFVTGNGIPHPYIYTLVLLQHPPRRWFSEPKVFIDGPLPGGWFPYEQICLRYGKFHFLFEGADDGALDELRNDGRPQRVLLLVRPNELARLSHGPPLFTVRDPRGRETLWVVEATL
jgi:hypothetical protein